MTPRQEQQLARRLAFAYHIAELSVALAIVGVLWSAYWLTRKPKLVETRA